MTNKDGVVLLRLLCILTRWIDGKKKNATKQHRPSLFSYEMKK